MSTLIRQHRIRQHYNLCLLPSIGLLLVAALLFGSRAIKPVIANEAINESTDKHAASKVTPVNTVEGNAVERKAERIKIVSDIAPVHSLVAAITKGISDPQILVDQSMSPHHFASRPSHARQLQNADVVVVLGGDLLPQISSLINAVAADKVTVSLLDVPGSLILKNKYKGFSDQSDPHAWLNPANAVHWISHISSVLAQQDPHNAEHYQRNANQIIANIESVQLRIATALSPFKNVPYVVQHDAYGYFENAFGLTGGAAIALSDARSPSASQLREIQKLSVSAACLFSQAGHDDSFVELLSARSTARRAVLDPLGTQLSLGPTLYIELLEELSVKFEGCLGAGP